MHKVIDLFSGVGGLSLGAAQAGFDVCCAVETDAYARETHTQNFPHTTHVAADVATLSGTALLEHASAMSSELVGLIGGPPCQGFSTIGHRRLQDSRNTLFTHFFRLVAELKPSFYLAENVPGILNNKYEEHITVALAQIPEAYISLPPIEITASDYGVPTSRKRVFFVGYLPEFIKHIDSDTFRPSHDTQAFTVKHALAGLPKVVPGDWQNEDSSWRKLSRCKDITYSRRISESVPQGVGDAEALARFWDRGEVSGCLGTRHSEEVAARYGALKPNGKDPVSRSVRLDMNGLCPTLRAGTDREHGSYQAVRPIHPTQPRVITPREAARLQGFPDWFRFHPTKWHSFRQIGNSVSPVVAQILLKRIALAFK